MSKVRVGLSGYGTIAGEHAAALQNAGATLVAVAGPNQDEAATFAKRFEISHVYESLDELVADPTIDAVVVASPSDVHANQTRLALSTGKHVLCEIPLATSLSDAQSLAAQADARDLRLMVCHTQRFFMPIRMLVEGLLSSSGAVSHVIAITAFRRHMNVSGDGRPRTWTDDLLWHHGGHAIDTCLLLLNEGIARVSAYAGQVNPGTGKPMDLSIILRTSGGRIANIALSYHSTVSFNTYLVIGDSDTYAIDKWTLRSHDRLLYETVSERSALSEAIGLQDAEFLAAILNRRSPTVSAAHVLPAIAVQDRVGRLLSSGPAQRRTVPADA